MSKNSFTDVASSFLLAVITGLYGFGGLAIADYVFLSFRPGLYATGAVLFLFGVVNLPLFVLWTSQTANEIARLTADRSRSVSGA